MNEGRPAGIVKNFRLCDITYLDLIRSDLHLQADLAFLRFLQQLYREERKDPTVDALYLDCIYANRSDAFPEWEVLTDFSADQKEIPHFFSEFVRENRNIFPETAPGLHLSCAFDCICKPNLPAEYGSFSITSANNPEFSAAPGARVLCRTNRFQLFYTEEIPRKANPNRLLGLLLYPRGNNTAESFMEAASGFLAEVYRQIPDAYAIPCSRNGLLWDVSHQEFNGMILTNRLPFAEIMPEDCIRSLAPGVILMLPEDVSEAVKKMAQERGFYAEYVLILSNSFADIQIFSHRDTFGLNRDHLKRLQQYRFSSVRAEEMPLSKESDAVEVRGNADVEAFVLSGTPYEAMEAVFLPSCAYGIAAVLNPTAPDTVPLLLSLRAFLQNHEVRVAASFCEYGASNSVTVFRLGNTGITQDRKPLFIPKYTVPAAPEPAESPNAQTEEVPDETVSEAQ